MRSLFCVRYYVNGESATAYVGAFSAAEAIKFLGVVDGSATASIVASPLECAGVDQPHAELEPTPTIILPPYVPLFTPSELEGLGEHFTAEEIDQVRSKLTPVEIAELRLKPLSLTAAEVEKWKVELNTRESRYVYCHQ